MATVAWSELCIATKLSAQSLCGKAAPVICGMAPPIHLGAWSMAMAAFWGVCHNGYIP